MDNPYESPQAVKTPAPSRGSGIAHFFRIVAIVLGVVSMLGACNAVYQEIWLEVEPHIVRLMRLGAFNAAVSAIMLYWISRRL